MLWMAVQQRWRAAANMRCCRQNCVVYEAKMRVYNRVC
eukprot:COSAG01_NODE_323_length_18848_cov_144.375273_13_plen_37_part_01